MEKFVYLSYIKHLKNRIEDKNGLVQVLVGPRQVGKTTSILKLIEDYFHDQSLYVSADQIFNSNAEWLIEQWRLANEKKMILFVDEIQKCENWAEVIKKLYDGNKRNKLPVRCVLLGSSSLEIQKGLTESLAGRFQLTQAFHWNFEESQAGYNLSFDEYLMHGGYPGSYQFKSTKDWSDYLRHSIVNTVIEKDILQYNNVKSPSLFRQAFEILISYPAQEISYTKLLGQIQDRGNVDLIKYYIRLFEGAFLIKTLEKFSPKVVKMKSSSPKVLPMAPCFYQLGLLDKYNSEERGRAFELLVGAQLVRTQQDLYYWRDGKDEVDFVLRRGKKIWGIEVKSGRKKSQNGLVAFQKKFSAAKSVVIDPENYFTFEKDPLQFLEFSN